MEDTIKTINAFGGEELELKDVFNSNLPRIPARKYKDTVFTALFKEKQYAKLLYECLFGEESSISEDDIEILNLENIFTADIYNDSCILVKDILFVLTEHQSTINHNMPMRMLLYVAEEYKRLFTKHIKKDLYKAALVQVPAPRFYVVYTGTGAYPSSLKLTEAFKVPVDTLELVVNVVNKNTATGILREYISFAQEADAALNGCPANKRVEVLQGIVDKYKGTDFLISDFFLIGEEMSWI